jgi:septal ring factor EnvC (AmiA/AmiB activator)
MKEELVKIDPTDFGLEESQVKTIEQAFLPKITERDGYAQVYDVLIKKELTKELCGEARELRLKLVKTRTGISDIHKTQKAFFLAAGKFVDAWKNKETLPVEQMEEKLSEIEKYFENIEKERIEKLNAERIELINKYTDYPAAKLGEMDDVVFNSYLIGLKVAYDAKIKAEEEAEAERLRLIEVEKENARLKAIEDEKIRKENERLKKEAEEKEKQLIAERKKTEAEKMAIEEKSRKEREENERKLTAEREAAQIKLRAEQENAKKLIAEIEAKKEAEEKVRKEAEEKEKVRLSAENKAKNAPDKEKLINLALQFEGFIFPEMKGEEAQKILADVKTLLNKVSMFIVEKTNTL